MRGNEEKKVGKVARRTEGETFRGMEEERNTARKEGTLYLISS